MLLVASLGAVFILLTTYVSMFASERRAYLVLWFLGWAVIALNYALNAFFSDLLRANRLIFLISTSSYFLADLMIFFGTYSFLEIRIAKPLWIGGAVVWMAGFAALATAGVKDYILIVCVNASLFLMALRIGISMIRVGRRQRRLAHFLGVLNLAWVLCAVLSSYVFSLNQLFVYVVMHGIRFANAIGLIQMSFGAQKGKIESGFARIKRLLERDELTGLHNKTYFDEKIRALDQSADCLPVSLLFGDMNGLKFVNDAFGHQEATAGSKEPRAFFRKPAARGTSSRGGAGTNSR